MRKKKNIQSEVASAGRGGMQPSQKPNVPKTAKAPAKKGPHDGAQIGGTELFSLFTANIIKEEKVFTR